MMSREFSVTFASREGRSARVNFAQKYPSNGHLLSMMKPTQRPIEFVVTFLIYCFTQPVTLTQFLLFCIKKKGKKDGIKWFMQTFPLIKKPWSLIHFEFGTISRELIFIADFFKAQTMTSFRGYDIAYVGLENPTFYSEVWKKSTAIHFLGNDLFQKGVNRGFDPNKPYFLVPPAIFPEKFIGTDRFLPTDQTQPIKIVSVGRLTWKKGYVFGLMAVKNLINEGYNVQYLSLIHI
jgi:glycosyltransferase involved in cell wall biosynthesis